MRKTIVIPEQYEKYIDLTEDLFNGEKVCLKFENGYGASIIHHDYSYGLELAVVGPNGKLDYTTDITGDVVGHLDQEKLAETLRDIQKL